MNGAERESESKTQDEDWKISTNRRESIKACNWVVHAQWGPKVKDMSFEIN